MTLSGLIAELAELDAVYLRDGTLRIEAIATYSDGKRFKGRYHVGSGHVSMEKWTTGYAGTGGYGWRTWANPPYARTYPMAEALKARLEEARAIADAHRAKAKATAIAKFHADTEKQYAPDMHALLNDIYLSGALKLLNDSALDERAENLLAIVGQKAPGED